MLSDCMKIMKKSVTISHSVHVFISLNNLQVYFRWILIVYRQEMCEIQPLSLLWAICLVFSPIGATLCTDQNKFWHGEVHLSKFYFDWCSGMRLQPQNSENFDSIFHLLQVTHLGDFNKSCVYSHILWHYSQFYHLWYTGNQILKTIISKKFGQWHFSLNLQHPLPAKLLIGYEKVSGPENGTYLLCQHAKFGSAQMLHASVRREFEFCSFVYHACHTPGHVLFNNM